ncbi:MAG: exodeoxyribonuclease III [Acidimicrobiia bacterium]|nr:exodeoxyribonuclease III [Acidimicrobiia bacterium]MCY4456866.1 exodeoxyribonuclease III [Acidimicrobiaceae bacterium]
MRIATWNVNSLKARLRRVERWLEMFEPDVLCLQETKLADEAFPAMTFEALGYDSFHHGEGRWNGVAILSRVGIEDPLAGFGDGKPADSDARLAWATCGGVRLASCYVPNGRALDHEHYQYKLRWLDRLLNDLDGQCVPSEDIVVCGDFNIAPQDRDVYDPKHFETHTHTSKPERQRIAALADWGLNDVFREHHQDQRLYSWWDYRGGNFHKKMGMRIDLVLTSQSLTKRTELALIDRNERKGPKDDPPSDHAPVFIDLNY